MADEKTPILSASCELNGGTGGWRKEYDSLNKKPSTSHETEIRIVQTPDKYELSPEEALAHLIKGLTGTGLLSLPAAFKNAGLWTGLLSLVLICFFDSYCMRMLERAAFHYKLKTKRETIDYANLFRFSLETGAPELKWLGYPAKLFVNFQIFFAQIGTCCIYFVFLAENSQEVVQFWTGIENGLSVKMWITIWLIPILPLCMLRHLKQLSLAALLADVVYLGACVITFSFIFNDLRPTSSLPAFNSWHGVFMALGSIMYAFEGVCLVLPISNQTERSTFTRWNGVLNTGCVLVTCIYATVGFFGYLKMGENVHDSITLSLPETGLYTFVRVGFCMAIFVTFAIQFYVPMERIEKFIRRKVWVNRPKRQMALYYLVRVALVMIIYTIALLVPHLNLIIALIGAYGSSSLALFFPAIIDVLLYRAEHGYVDKWVLAKNSFVFVLSLVAIATGTYSAVLGIVQSFENPT